MKSLAATPRLVKYFAVAEFFEILPAGEIWSVVIESGRFNKQYAFLTGWTVVGTSLLIPVKNGGKWI